MIFWKYIKGLNEGTPAQAGDPIPQFFTFLKFSNAGSGYSCELLPEIYVNTSNSFGGTNLGKIITSDATNQTINKELYFPTIGNKIYFNAINAESNAQSWIYNEANYFEFHSKKRTVVSSGASLDLLVPIGSTPSWEGIKITGNTSSVLTKGTVTIGTGTNNFDTVINGYCQAIYFNATSDRRAKINIKPLNLSALELVKRVPICSFTYKDSDLPSIGIIAQDVQDVEIEGFKLVDNEQASGKDYDYMSIHESKLTYILWKAVQEQQEQINLLKEEIEQLKKRG